MVLFMHKNNLSGKSVNIPTVEIGVEVKKWN